MRVQDRMDFHLLLRMVVNLEVVDMTTFYSCV